MVYLCHNKKNKSKNYEFNILDKILSIGIRCRRQDILKEFKLKQPRFDVYIKKLIEKGYIFRREHRREYPNHVYYYMSENIESFKKLFFEYSRESKEQWFHSTIYCQEMITPKLLRKIEKLWNTGKSFPSKAVVERKREEWNIKVAQDPSKIAGAHPDLTPVWSDISNLNTFGKRMCLSFIDCNFLLDKVHSETDKKGRLYEPYRGYGTPEFFTEEDVLEILKLSPTALKKALDGAHKEGMGTSNFKQMLLASMILDSSTKPYPKHQFVTELKIQFNEIGKTDKKFERHCETHTWDLE